MRRPLALGLALSTFAAGCGGGEARPVRVELEVARPGCTAADCAEHLVGAGVVVTARVLEAGDPLSPAEGQSLLYAEARRRSGALAILELAWGGLAAPRARYREVEQGRVRFDGADAAPRLTLPAPSAPWLEPGRFAFLATPVRADSSTVSQVVRAGTVIPLWVERLAVEAEAGGPPDTVDTSPRVVVVLDGRARYETGDGCDPGDPGPSSSGEPIGGDPAIAAEGADEGCGAGPEDPSSTGDPDPIPPPTGSDEGVAGDVPGSAGGAAWDPDEPAPAVGAAEPAADEASGCEGDPATLALAAPWRPGAVARAVNGGARRAWPLTLVAVWNRRLRRRRAASGR